MQQLGNAARGRLLLGQATEVWGHGLRGGIFCVPGKWKLAGTRWFLSKLRQYVYDLIRHWVGLVSCPIRSADRSVWHVAQEQRVCLQPMTHPEMDQIIESKNLLPVMDCLAPPWFLQSHGKGHTWQVTQVKVPWTTTNSQQERTCPASTLKAWTRGW